MSTLTRILLFVGLVALAVMTGNATAPQPAPTATAVAARTPAASPVSVVQAGQGTRAPQGQPEGYTCTSASSCAVLSAALGGSSDAPQAAAPTHRQPRAQRPARSTQHRSSGRPQGEVVYHGPPQCFEDGHCRMPGDRMLSPRQVTGIIAGLCEQQGPGGPACRVLATR